MEDHAGHDHGAMTSGASPSQEGAMHMSMMKMWFHFGTSETVLFTFWKISSVGGLIGSMIGIFLLAMLYEGLKVLRDYLHQVDLERQGSRSPILRDDGSVESPRLPPKSPFTVGHLIQTLLHLVQISVSYLLMLIFMTYNVWLCLSVVFGAGCGFFAFGWKRKNSTSDSNEHCH